MFVVYVAVVEYAVIFSMYMYIYQLVAKIPPYSLMFNIQGERAIFPDDKQKNHTKKTIQKNNRRMEIIRSAF